MANIPPRIRVNFEGKPSQELFSMAEEIEAMQAAPGWTVLQDALGRGRENLRRNVESGAIFEHAQTQRFLGFLDGTAQAEEVARQIIQAASDRRLELEREAAEAKERDAEPAIP